MDTRNPDRRNGRSPRKTYGDALVEEILAVTPDAIIWNTDEHGKPDLVSLAYATYASFGAEAVICISNKTVTWQVVHALECVQQDGRRGCDFM